ncbi:ankyrin repeat domain-containing protein, partial [Crocosphaera watsonii]
TPLHNAAMYANKETVEVLINHGADVNVQDNDGNTPLNHAEWRKHREIIVLLKKHGAR